MGCWPSTQSETGGDNSLLDECSVPLLTENSLHDIRRSVDPKLDRLLMKLDHARTWKRNISSMTQLEIKDYRNKILDLFKTATIEMTRLTKEERFNDCDDIVDSILKLKLAIGEECFEAAKINAFGRETSTFVDFVLTVGQYFKPVMLCEEDDSVLKLYFFLISEAETAKIRLRYYVEHTSLVEDYFALGLVTNGHTQVKVYGSSCPSYWKIRQDVLSDARRRLADKINANE